jgi:hypothetical protein
MGSCPNPNSDLFDIDIGDYEGQLEAWNDMNVLDYRLFLTYLSNGYDRNLKQALITVKNGIPESSEPSGWLPGGNISTVPELFSFIKEEEERLRDGRFLLDSPGYFYVYYDFQYHYPDLIEYAHSANSSNRTPDWTWYILMMPLVENEQEAWNSQDMLDYKFSLSNAYDDHPGRAFITVKNGIPESSDPPEWLSGGNMSTVPELFSFIKEEEKRLENVRATIEGYFRVIYDPVYRYPSHISTWNRGLWTQNKNPYVWNITLTPTSKTK